MGKVMVIYTRVSTDKQEQKLSLQIQRDYYEDYAKKKLHKLHHIYADEGLSGTNARREQFKQMLYDAGLDYVRNDRGSDQFNISDREPKFDLIVVKDVSRFARNTVVGFDTVKNLRSKGVEVLFENNGLSSFNEIADQYLPFLFGMAESESKGISKKVSFTKLHQAKKGIYKPSIVPFGFKRAEDKTLIIDEFEAEVVRWIFKRFTEVGAKTIAMELNKQGLNTRHNKKFATTTINRMIRNPIYYGDVLYNKRSKKNITDTKLTKNEPEDMIMITNAVPPIIDRELWDECNRFADKRTNPKTNKGAKQAINDVFFQKLYCLKCGSRLTRHMTTGRQKINYICINRRVKGSCNARSISFNQLKVAMVDIKIDHVLNLLNNNQDYKELRTAIIKIKCDMTERKTELKNKIDELEKLNKSATNMMIQMFSTENDSDMVATIRETIEERTQEIKVLKYQDAQLNLDYIQQFEIEVNEKYELVRSFMGRLTNTFEEKIDLLEKVIVDDHILTFHFTTANFKSELIKLKERYGVEVRGIGDKNSSYTVPRKLPTAQKYFDEVYLKQRNQQAEDYFMSEEYQENQEIGRVIQDES